jgi:hypothetical protein
MPFYDPDRVRVPVLHMVRREWVPRETSGLWAAMRNAERTKLVFEDPALDHLDFASMGYASTLAGLRPEKRETIARTFAGWQRATLWFFDAHLKGDAAARARVASLPAGLDLAAAAVSAERLPGTTGALDEQQLAEALVDDFAGALRRARELLGAGGGTPSLERSLNFSGYSLLALGRTADAVAVFQLNADAFPTSANVWDSLADGFEAAGDNAQALAASRKALDLLAKDATTPEARRDAIRRSAEDRLARLQAPKAAR